MELIRPDLIVPVHTEQPEWFRRFEGGHMRVELPERGRPIEIAS